MNKRIRLLIAEDNANDAELVVRELRRVGFDPEWNRVQTEPDFLAQLDTVPDLIISDYSMPQFTGLRAAELLHHRGLDIPFILVSGTVGEEAAVDAMKQGVTDYLLKDRIARLGRAVERALEEKRLRAERKRAAEALQESQQRLEAIINSVDGIVWEANAQTFQFTFVNKKAEQMLGYPVERWLAEPTFWQDHVHPDDRASAMELCSQAVKELRPHEFEYRMLTATGREVWVKDIVSVISEQGKAVKLRGIIVDITERKADEVALRESEHKYRHLFESLSDAALLVDEATGRILDTNSRGEALFGRTRGEIMGLNQRELYPPERYEEFRQKLSASENGPLGEYETEIVTKDGRRVPVQISAASITFHGRELILRLFRDITERRQIEEQLRQLQKTEAIGQLVGGVAHDFNNILTVINGYSEMLLSDPDLMPGTMESLREIYRAGDRAGKLTRQLLAFSRKQEICLQLLDLNELVVDMAGMLRRLISEHIQLQFQPEPGLPLLEADTGMMEQVLLNLSVNARDAMPKGGRLCIRTETRIIDEPYARLQPQARAGKFICLSAGDSGCGMAPEVMAHIFEPFFTTKEAGKGTGLGLATIYGIVKQHQGWIEVESQVGVGSTFKVFLPVASSAAARNAAKVAKPSVEERGTETILLVEDEEAVRGMAAIVLHKYGYRVLEAASGVEALRVWDWHKSRIDLLLTDMVMPDDMTGRELAEQLQAHKPELKVIYTSGYSSELMDQVGEFREKIPFIQKPYTPLALAQAVRAAFDGMKEETRQ